MELHDSLDGFEKDTALNGIAKKTSPVTSWNPATTLKVGWRPSALFDYEAYGRDQFVDDYQMDSNGHVFRRY